MHGYVCLTVEGAVGTWCTRSQRRNLVKAPKNNFFWFIYQVRLISSMHRHGHCRANSVSWRPSLNRVLLRHQSDRYALLAVMRLVACSKTPVKVNWISVRAVANIHGVPSTHPETTLWTTDICMGKRQTRSLLGFKIACLTEVAYHGNEDLQFPDTPRDSSLSWSSTDIYITV